MKKYKRCKFCEGTGKLGFQQEDCWFCAGSGEIEVRVLNDKDIRIKCNQIQKLLDGTDIDIPDNELIEILNNYKDN